MLVARMLGDQWMNESPYGLQYNHMCPVLEEEQPMIGPAHGIHSNVGCVISMGLADLVGKSTSWSVVVVSLNGVCLWRGTFLID